MLCSPDTKATWLKHGWKVCVRCRTQYYGRPTFCFESPQAKATKMSQIPDFDGEKFQLFPTYETMRKEQGNPISTLFNGDAVDAVYAESI